MSLKSSMSNSIWMIQPPPRRAHQRHPHANRRGLIPSASQMSQWLLDGEYDEGAEAQQWGYQPQSSSQDSCKVAAGDTYSSLGPDSQLKTLCAFL